MINIGVTVQKISNGYLVTVNNYSNEESADVGYTYTPPVQTYVATKEEVRNVILDATVTI